MKLVLDDMTDYVKEVDNVDIQFESHQSLISTLSKSTKQNLRTTENRLKKDGKNTVLFQVIMDLFQRNKYCNV